MKKLLLFLLLAGFLASFGVGSLRAYSAVFGYGPKQLQPAQQSTYWARAYGGANDDEARSIQQTRDGGYIVAGFTASFGAGGEDVWVLKLDQNGNVQWQRTYGGTGYDLALSVQQTRDGGYIVAGSTESFGAGGSDIWVLKLDSNGNVVWQRTYGGTGDDLAYSIQQTTDGGYIVAGETESFGAGGINAWVLKLDQNGGISGCRRQGTSNARVRNTNATVRNTNAKTHQVC